MKYATLTLNPALDKTMYFNKFDEGILNRAEGSNLALGSKGINVSRIFNILGEQCRAIAFCGGYNGRIMQQIANSESLPYEFIETRAETRMNVKIIETSTGICTECNELGGPITPDEYAELGASIERAFSEIEYLFLGGSVPKGIDPMIYSRLIKSGKSKGVKVILDCDGAALRDGVEHSPYMIKPNLFELEHLCGKELNLERLGDGSVSEASIKSICQICMQIHEKYNTKVLCTMSGDGAIYAGEEGTFYQSAPKVTLRGFAGAGDTFLATFIYKYTADAGDCAEALKFAASAAAAKVELEGTTLPTRDAMGKFL